MIRNVTFGVKVLHILGETNVVKKPERVVVFDYGILDTFENLGIDNVVGTVKSSLPEYLEEYNSEKYADLGGLKEPDLEAVKSANPDLIIISGRQEGFYDQLSEIAPTISTGIDSADYLGSFKTNLNYIGEIFEVEDEANEEFLKIESRLKEASKLVGEKNLNALTIMVNEGSLSAFGEVSRFGLIYQSLGFKNTDTTIEDSTHGQNISFEYLSKQNPDYLMVLDRGAVQDSTSTAQEVLNNDIVKSMDAYKNEKIIHLNAVAWYLTSGGITATNTMIDDIMNVVSK